MLVHIVELKTGTKIKVSAEIWERLGAAFKDQGIDGPVGAATYRFQDGLFAFNLSEISAIYPEIALIKDKS